VGAGFRLPVCLLLPGLPSWRLLLPDGAQARGGGQDAVCEHCHLLICHGKKGGKEGGWGEGESPARARIRTWCVFILLSLILLPSTCRSLVYPLFPPCLPSSPPQIVLCAATSLLKYVPMAVLGSVICVAVISLFDFHDMWRYADEGEREEGREGGRADRAVGKGGSTDRTDSLHAEFWRFFFSPVHLLFCT